ncbi:MAG: AAA family ATPase [Proteobacteria bacterium]|nr:AAA family ATPase [Pseudomonadota bacterium]
MSIKSNLNFPFSAIVGQERMKLAILLNVIDPTIGGVLIKGEKGTAKSTAVRALASLLPPIEVVSGCPFNCNPKNVFEMCDNCRERYEISGQLNSERTQIKIVNVPLGITEDRLLGTINIEKILKDGKKHFEPGLLAQANRGILYIDEVNLLEDHIVDELLDVSAMGINIVEREGISFSHPSRFVLIGTMNPEEGELRPQLLDRFGLCVEVETVKDIEIRKEIIKRRISFERNPKAFIKKWGVLDRRIGKQILKARRLLKKVDEKEWYYELISKMCILADVAGHRADTIILKAGKAFASWNGRDYVLPKDFLEVSYFVFLHRLVKNPLDEEKSIRELEENLHKIIKDFEDKEERDLTYIIEKKNLIEGHRN